MSAAPERNGPTILSYELTTFGTVPGIRCKLCGFVSLSQAAREHKYCERCCYLHELAPFHQRWARFQKWNRWLWCVVLGGNGFTAGMNVVTVNWIWGCIGTAMTVWCYYQAKRAFQEYRRHRIFLEMK